MFKRISDKKEEEERVNLKFKQSQTVKVVIHQTLKKQVILRKYNWNLTWQRDQKESPGHMDI